VSSIALPLPKSTSTVSVAGRLLDSPTLRGRCRRGGTGSTPVKRHSRRSATGGLVVMCEWDQTRGGPGNVIGGCVVTAWKDEELADIGGADELGIAPLRRDGTLQRPRII